MDFKSWIALTEDSNRTGAKLGLYPPLMDALGQYPPLYSMPIAADLITYYFMQYGKEGVDSSNGLIHYKSNDVKLAKIKPRKLPS